MLAVACGDSTGVDPFSLVGTWDYIGFTDDGVAAQTTGTWVFEADGTFTVKGTVTFPGEPTDDISNSGTFEQNGTAVVLILGSDRSDWTLSASGDVATLTEDEPPPANTITLRRR
jgi:hypothetical protein